MAAGSETGTEQTLGPLARRIREALLDAIAILLPVECAGCGGADRAVCAACRGALRPAPVRRILEPSESDRLVVHVGLEYRGVARRVLIALKEDGRTDAAGALVPALAAAVLAADREFSASPGPPSERATAVDVPITLCRVPSTRAAVRRRGYEPVRVLVSRCGLHARSLLRVTRATRVQKSLDRAARRRNTRGAMSARRPLTGFRVILVDDVATSGATLLEAARAVRAAGGEVLGAVAVASTPRDGRLRENSR